MKYGMDVFGFYFIKGLRGEAATPDGKITVKTLYDYLSREYRKKPKEYSTRSYLLQRENAETTTIYSVPTYPKS